MKFINQIHEHIKLCKNTNLPLKLEVGANNNIIENGWIKIKKDVLNITSKQNWYDIFFNDCIFDNIFTEHTLEHLIPERAKQTLKNFYTFLKKNNVVRIVVPDGYHKDELYINWVRPYKENEPFNHPWGDSKKSGVYDHKVLYNVDTLSELLKEHKFHCVHLEWWTKEKVFYYTGHNADYGYVKRSFEHDKRNVDNKPVYTSLIIDAYKN